MAKSRLVIDEINNQKEHSSKKVENKIEKIPNNYIPVYLPSEGKLSAPKVLHFRDYTMKDALELNTLDEDERFLALVSVLNNMCYEKFDCSNLHINELMIILFTIHATFISNKIEKEYYIDDTLPEGNGEGQLNHPSNIASVELFINKLKVKSIDMDEHDKEISIKFKEPFTITDNITKNTFKFRLSRVKDLLIAQEECKKIYEKELFLFRPIKQQLEMLRNINNAEQRKLKLDEFIEKNNKEYMDYYKFLHKYNEMYAMIVQAQQIIAVNNKELETIEDKLNAYKNDIPKDIWLQYNAIVEQYEFGIMSEQEFYSEVLQKNIIRRFLFQLSDFLPTFNTENSGRFSVSFN